VIQRVFEASVTVECEVIAEIRQGLLIFVGIEDTDTNTDIQWLSNKIVHLRIFNDKEGVMNCSVKEMNGDILLVSQFTLYASTKKGSRPGYFKASKASFAVPLYQQVTEQLSTDLQKEIKIGIFGAEMKVALINDGPVTIIIDTKNKE
jgi:D-tyrosyl-tRNA(Tyr) deacylase